MDPRLIQYYDLELRHLSEMGEEFARNSPKVAARLGMKGLEVADPYVERLREGVAFLAARVQLKLDAEFPRFTQALLEIVHPHYLAPTPAMLVAQLTPDPTEPNLAAGSKIVPRGSILQSLTTGDVETACQFRTAQDVTLWPIEIVSASYFSFAPDLPLNSVPVARRIEGGVRLRLKPTGGMKFDQIALDRLRLYATGHDDVASKLYELCVSSPLGVLALPAKGKPEAYEFLPPGAVRPVGFADDEALLPVGLRSFQGYRLLQEYFSFPQRYRFFDLTGLAPAVRQARDELEIVILLGRGDATLESDIDRANFALFCTPAINLFPKRADRINVSDGAYEYHLVPDRTRPMDFEIYDITGVAGHGIGTDSEQEFLPFYSTYSTDEQHQQGAYFTVRREPRLTSSTEKRRGSRSSYVGSEVFLSLVDQDHAPFSSDLRQLSVRTVCTNRDLVLQMPMGLGKSDFSLNISAPVTSIRVISGPSRPYAPLADGAACWRAISHLSLNYLSLVDSTEAEGASALRELLRLYAVGVDASAKQQIDGIRSVKVERVVRKLRGPGPLVFGRGIEISVTVEDLAFPGGTAYLLGSVLDRYFARHVSINSFTETVLRSEGRGEISRWVPEQGKRPTL